MHLASDVGFIECVKFLIKKGINDNLTSDKGLTPLHRAVLMNNYEIAEYLISNGADVMQKLQDKNKRQYFYRPAGTQLKKRLPCVNFLLKTVQNLI